MCSKAELNAHGGIKAGLPTRIQKAENQKATFKRGET